MSNPFNTLKSTQIIGTNNIGAGYSLDISGAAHFASTLLIDDYASTGKTTFSGQQFITKNYADATYLGATSSILSNSNTWTNTNQFNNGITLSNSNLAFSGSSSISTALTVSGDLDVATINHGTVLQLQTTSGNKIQIGSGSAPTKTLEVNGTALITGAVNLSDQLSLTKNKIITTGTSFALGNSNFNNTTIGADNLALGASALQSINSSGSNNIAVGSSSLSNLTSGGGNIGIGKSSLVNLTTGSENIGIGYQALNNCLTARNTAIGTSSFNSNVSGTNNTGLGWGSGKNLTGSNNVCIGYNTGASSTSSFSNSIAIGSSVEITDSNQINIGTALQTTNINGIINAPYLMPAGSILTHASSNYITGYLLCDGSSYLNTDYPQLYASIGSTYGSVDSSHFNVPNFSGMFLRGNGTNSINTPLFTSEAIGTFQTPAIRAHRHIAPNEPTNTYVAGSTSTSVINNAIINTPSIGLPIQNISLGSISVPLGTFDLLGYHVNLGSVSVPLPNFQVNLGSILIPNELVTTSTNVLATQSFGNFANYTGAIDGGSVNIANENRVCNYSVYYHIKY